MPIGSVVEVLRESDNGWWLIRYPNPYCLHCNREYEEHILVSKGCCSPMSLQCLQFISKTYCLLFIILFSFNDKVGYIPSMYLQPYNNPRGGLYSLHRKLPGSSLNLATSRGPQASHLPSINKENSPQLVSAGFSRGLPCRLHKALSLDVLSETLLQTQKEREASTSDGRTNSMTKRSSECSFSGLSSSSESSSSLKEEVEHQRHQSDVSESGSSSPDLSLSDRHSSSTGSFSSKDSETASVAPRVPPRPKTEEILTRCTTMTRKAALATKTRLPIQLSESIHSRS